MEPIEEIRSWWEVPSVAHFCSLFRAAFDLPDFDIEDLEEALLVSKHVESPFLQDLLCRLMNGCYGRDDICSYNCDLFLKDLVKYKWKHEGNEGESPLAGKSFNMLTIREKVEVLHSFCDSRLDAEDVMELLKGLEGENMRVEPLGKDGEGALYWYFYGSRLYKEDPEPVVEEEPKEKKKRSRKNKNAEQETKNGNKKELQKKKKQKQLAKKKRKKKEKKMQQLEEKSETNTRRSGRLAKKEQEQEEEDDEDSDCSSFEEENMDKNTLKVRRGGKKEADKTRMKSKDEPKMDTNGNVRRSGRIAKREEMEKEEEDSEGTDFDDYEEEYEDKMVRDKKLHTKRKMHSTGVKNKDAKSEAEEDKMGIFGQLDRNEDMEATQQDSGCSEEKDEKASCKDENVNTNNGDKGQIKIEEQRDIKAEGVNSEHMEVNENHKENDVEREDTAKVIEEKMVVVNDNKQEIKKEIMPEIKMVETSRPHPPPSSSRWHLICETLQDWMDLAVKFKGSNVRSERSLAKAVQEDFLPVLPEIIENREKEKRRRLLEQAPRRLSNRIEAKKKEQEEQERIVEEARAEEEKARQKFLEEQRKKQEEERIEEERKLREERIKAREERSKRLQLREERARLMAEGKEIPEELWNHGTKNKYKDGYDSEDSRSDILSEDEIAGMIKVVEAVKANKDSWPFLEPVTEEQAPGYHDVIKRPMDLSKIETKANRREYKSRKQFYNDFSLMFNNCRRFNGPKSDFTQMARSIERSLGKYFKKYLPNDIPDYMDDDDFVGKDIGSVYRRFRPQRAASSKGLQTIHRALRDNDDSSNSEEDRSPSPLHHPVKLWAQRDIETEEHIKNILSKEDSPAKRLQAMIQAKRNNQPFIYPRKSETTLDNDSVVIRPKPNVVNKNPQEGVMIIPKEELPTDGVLRLAATREIRWKPSGIFNGARQDGKSFSTQKSSCSNFTPFYLSKDKQALSSETSSNSLARNSGSSTNQHPLTHVMPHLVAKHGQSGGTVQVKSVTPTTSPITGNKIITIVTSGQGQSAPGSTVPGVQVSEDGYLVINGQKTEIKGTGKIKVVFQQPKTSPAIGSPVVSTPQHTSAIAGLSKLQIGRVAHSTVNSPEIQATATTLFPNSNLPRMSQNSGDTNQQQPIGPLKDPRLGVSKISPVINSVYSAPTSTCPIQKQEPKLEEKVRIPFRISEPKVKTLQSSDTLTFDYETEPKNHRKEESIESYLLKKRKVIGVNAYSPKQPRLDSDSLNMQTSPPSLLEHQSSNRVENLQNNANPVFSTIPCTLANSTNSTNKPVTSMTDTVVQSVNITSDILSSYYSVFNSSKGESKVNDQIPPPKLDIFKANSTNQQEVRTTIPQKIGETRRNIQSLPVSSKPPSSIVQTDTSNTVMNIHPGHSEIHHYNISKSGSCAQEKLSSSSTLSINVSDKISPPKVVMNHWDLSPGKNRLSLFDVFADQSTTRKDMEDTNNLPLQNPVRNSPIKSQNLLSALKSKLSASVASKTAAESEQHDWIFEEKSSQEIGCPPNSVDNRNLALLMHDSLVLEDTELFPLSIEDCITFPIGDASTYPCQFFNFDGGIDHGMNQTMFVQEMNRQTFINQPLAGYPQVPTVDVCSESHPPAPTTQLHSSFYQIPSTIVGAGYSSAQNSGQDPFSSMHEQGPNSIMQVQGKDSATLTFANNMNVLMASTVGQQPVQPVLLHDNNCDGIILQGLQSSTPDQQNSNG